MRLDEISALEFELERLAHIRKECNGIAEMLRKDFIGQCSSREQLDKIQGTLMTVFQTLEYIAAIQEYELREKLQEAVE